MRYEIIYREGGYYFDANMYLIKDITNKEIVANDIYRVLETCRILAVLLFPLVPDLSHRILLQLKVDINSIDFQSSLRWGHLNPSNGLGVPNPVMEKIDHKDTFIS